MVNKYGIYQSTSKSCIFYKEDDDGNQSIFNLFVMPSEEKQGLAFLRRLDYLSLQLTGVLSDTALAIIELLDDEQVVVSFNHSS